MHKQIVLLSACALGLGACVSTASNPAPPPAAASVNETCNQAPGQAFVGKTLTAEVGQQVLEATGARKLRWGPPRTALTMDFRAGRVTISYDDSMVITRVSCG